MPRKSTEFGSNSVDAFIRELDHPLKEVVIRLRQLILASEPLLTEQVKWNAPSFCYNGDDRLTMNLSKKDQVLLIFHLGAKSRDEKKLETVIRDPGNLLEWLASNRAALRFRSVADLNTHEQQVKKLILQWLITSAAISD